MSPREVDLILAQDLRDLKLGRVLTEYKFDIQRKWRFDFAIPEIRLAVELEGGSWLPKSRHTTGDGFAKDCEKYAEAFAQGWKVLRVTTQQALNGEARFWLRKWKEYNS